MHFCHKLVFFFIELGKREEKRRDARKHRVKSETNQYQNCALISARHSAQTLLPLNSETPRLLPQKVQEA